MLFRSVHNIYYDKTEQLRLLIIEKIKLEDILNTLKNKFKKHSKDLIIKKVFDEAEYNPNVSTKALIIETEHLKNMKAIINNKQRLLGTIMDVIKNLIENINNFENIGDMEAYYDLKKIMNLNKINKFNIFSGFSCLLLILEKGITCLMYFINQNVSAMIDYIEYGEDLYNIYVFDEIIKTINSPVDIPETLSVLKNYLYLKKETPANRKPTRRSSLLVVSLIKPPTGAPIPGIVPFKDAEVIGSDKMRVSKISNLLTQIKASDIALFNSDGLSFKFDMMNDKNGLVRIRKRKLLVHTMSLDAIEHTQKLPEEVNYTNECFEKEREKIKNQMRKDEIKENISITIHNPKFKAKQNNLVTNTLDALNKIGLIKKQPKVVYRNNKIGIVSNLKKINKDKCTKISSINIKNRHLINVNSDLKNEFHRKLMLLTRAKSSVGSIKTHKELKINTPPIKTQQSNCYSQTLSNYSKLSQVLSNRKASHYTRLDSQPKNFSQFNTSSSRQIQIQSQTKIFKSDDNL